MPTVVGRDDALEVRVGLQQALGLLEGLLVVVVAVGGLDELDLLVLGLGELVLHELDPGVLVRRVRRRGEDRDLAALRADLLGQQLHLAAAEVLGGGLVDEEVTARGVGVRVVGDDLDAGRLGLLAAPGTTAFGSLAEMTIASCFCVVSVLMYDTCDDAWRPTGRPA